MNATADSGSALLRCEHVSVARGKRTVLTDITAELRAGEIVALLGPNGAGKSTLLEALAGGLLPASGVIERHGRVAIALQSAELFRRSALDNVTLALAWWGTDRAERGERARRALAAMGAEHLADRAATSLSGGERRRVHIARTLALDPEILLLDEPFAGLDAEARANLLEDAASALRNSCRATLVVVHDRAEAWALADRLLIMIEGRLVANGSPRQLLEDPPSRLVARFLGFDGLLRNGNRVTMTRPSHVTLDPAGPLRARVTRAVNLEDGARLELELDNGKVYATAPFPNPRVGDTVRLRVEGGVEFPSDDGDSVKTGLTRSPSPEDRRR